MVFLFVKIGTLFSLPNYGSLDYSLHVVQMRTPPGGQTVHTPIIDRCEWTPEESSGFPC
jgi:hypothetical protein